MEGYRAGYCLKKLLINQAGVSLISAVLIALFGLLALAGLYFALTKLLGSSQTIKTYTTVRDAVVGGVNYGVSLIHSGDILEDEWEEGPRGYYCIEEPIEINFKLYGHDAPSFANNITVCRSKEPMPGCAYTGSAYLMEECYTWVIISEVPDGPQDTRSRIEAVYFK